MVREDPAEPPPPPKSYPAEKARGGDIISENDNPALRDCRIRAARIPDGLCPLVFIHARSASTRVPFQNQEHQEPL
jgi:hypothetical protein